MLNTLLHKFCNNLLSAIVNSLSWSKIQNRKYNIWKLFATLSWSDIHALTISFSLLKNKVIPKLTKMPKTYLLHVNVTASTQLAISEWHYEEIKSPLIRCQRIQGVNNAQAVNFLALIVRLLTALLIIT